MISWTIYDHPNDFPNNFVARQFVSFKGSPELFATTNMMICPDIEPIREQLRAAGLFPIPRLAEDLPAIVETWL